MLHPSLIEPGGTTLAQPFAHPHPHIQQHLMMKRCFSVPASLGASPASPTTQRIVDVLKPLTLSELRERAPSPMKKKPSHVDLVSLDQASVKQSAPHVIGARRCRSGGSISVLEACSSAPGPAVVTPELPCATLSERREEPKRKPSMPRTHSKRTRLNRLIALTLSDDLTAACTAFEASRSSRSVTRIPAPMYDFLTPAVPPKPPAGDDLDLSAIDADVFSSYQQQRGLKRSRDDVQEPPDVLFWADIEEMEGENLNSCT